MLYEVKTLPEREAVEMNPHICCGRHVRQALAVVKRVVSIIW